MVGKGGGGVDSPKQSYRRGQHPDVTGLSHGAWMALAIIWPTNTKSSLRLEQPGLPIEIGRLQVLSYRFAWTQPTS